MGSMQNNPDGRGGKKKKRGTVKNSGRLAAFSKAATEGAGDWRKCTPERVQSVIVGITALGGAVTFGLSRDMGAHSLTLMLDNNRETLWFNGDADLDAELEGVVQTLNALT